MAASDRNRPRHGAGPAALMSTCGTVSREGHSQAPASCEGHLRALADASRSLLGTSSPACSAADAAALVCAALRAAEDAERRPVTCAALSLADAAARSAARSAGAQHLRRYAQHVCAELQRHTDFMDITVGLLGSEDQMIAHLAAKSVSSCVLLQLQLSHELHPVWRKKCEQAFLGPALSSELDACMWSLTDVLKRLMRGRHQDLLMKLLDALDSSLASLTSRLLPDQADVGAGLSATTLCTFLDLLEVLTASRSCCGSGGCLQSQRLMFLHCRPLLRLASSSSVEYFARKRVLLLVKRVLLQVAGEDMSLGERQAGPYDDEEAGVLAVAVLEAVSAGWLESLQVESQRFFGGICKEDGDQPPRKDSVMLRAVGLVLLKAVDLKPQTHGAAGATGSVDALGWVQTLLDFVRQHGVLPTELRPHRCSWLGTLFGEQDDDQMEAAKALLSIFLHHRRSSGSRDPVAAAAACSFGCNPHCHFLLLLRGVSFDHSSLLDFLISTETCFLEYFVRYLKFAVSDWPGFTQACRRADVWEAQPVDAPRLVDYGSSDESDPEEAEASAGPQKQKDSGQTASQVASCLSELRDVVSRLQARRLFPYKAASLLKLLDQVGALHSSQHS